jgi:hypothetical protein
MTSDDLSDVSPPSAATQRRPRRWPAVTALIAAGLACLAIAIVAGLGADADATRGPTAAQRAAAAATAVADRWRTWPAGRIFPASISYSTNLLTTETAGRIAIAPQTSCAGAIDPAAARLAARDRCRAGLRATYVDQLGGTLYTVGVLAFPTSRLATAFVARLPTAGTDGLVLRAFALAGTASARFTAPARQAATSRVAGPFVVLTVAGYTDGEPSGPGQEPRTGIFAPARQLAAEVASALSRAVHVNCGNPEWSC